MEYTNLNGTGLQVSRLCLGAMTFGGQVEEADAVRMAHYAFDRGINFIDTADTYTGGRSEAIVGKAIADRRDRLVVATKVGNKMTPDGQKDLSRRHILERVEKSLRQLGTDYIDLYYIHLPDHRTPFEEVLDTMTTLVRAGKVRYIGISNFAAWELEKMSWLAKERCLLAPVVTQNVYNIVTRSIEAELLPFVKDAGMGLITYNPLAGGLLSGKYADKTIQQNTRFTLHQDYRGRYWNDQNLHALDELASIASGMGITMAELAIRWVATQSCVNSILLGFSKMEHLEANMTSFANGPLPEEALSACNLVWDQVSGGRFQYNR